MSASATHKQMVKLVVMDWDFSSEEVIFQTLGFLVHWLRQMVLHALYQWSPKPRNKPHCLGTFDKLYCSLLTIIPALEQLVSLMCKQVLLPFLLLVVIIIIIIIIAIITGKHSWTFPILYLFCSLLHASPQPFCMAPMHFVPAAFTDVNQSLPIRWAQLLWLRSAQSNSSFIDWYLCEILPLCTLYCRSCCFHLPQRRRKAF